jgi:hypothetical protein
MNRAKPEPHSRWRLRESLDLLAVTYDAAETAIDAFAGRAAGYDPLAAPPRAGVRLRTAAARWAASRGLPVVFWFAAAASAAGVFMAWVSLRVIRHFIPAGPPAMLAVVPGLLLTSALAGTAALTAARLAARGTEPGSWVPVRRAAILLAVAVIACVAWIALWLVSLAGMAAWIALIAAALAVSALAVTFVAASAPRPPQAGSPLPGASPGRPPRRLLDQQRSAQKRLRQHARRWSRAARQCGVAVGGTAAAEAALARLLTSGDLGNLPVTGMDVFHTQILTTLGRYRPDPLGARLRDTSRRLVADPPAQSGVLSNGHF